METVLLDLLIGTLLGGLICFRMALLVVFDTGPFHLFSRAREAIFERLGEDHWVTEGVHCFYCVGWWMSFLVGLVFIPLLSLGLVSYLILSLAIAGLSVFLYELTAK